MKNISVVISVYNAEETIQQCIKSVLENDYLDFEVVVVDDRSNDGSRYIFRLLFQI